MPWHNEGPQVPDTKPGAYYVTMRDGQRVAYLAGPFAKHEHALALVSDAMIEACKVRSEYHFCEFGTARMDAKIATDGTHLRLPAGVLNERLKIPAEDFQWYL